MKLYRQIALPSCDANAMSTERDAGRAAQKILEAIVSFFRGSVADLWQCLLPGVSRGRGQRYTRPILAEPLESRQLLAADAVISEFMARNDGGLRDGDGRTSDWIEIHNAGDMPVDLQGYRLTDKADNQNRWVFPSLNVDPGNYLVVFASGQDRDDYVDPEGHPHTNFTLKRSGEYLALVSPNGTVISEFGSSSENYPEQLANVSYGRAQSLTLVDPTGPATYWQPLDDRFGTQWTVTNFDAVANGFSRGTASIGYESRPTNRANFMGQFDTELVEGTHAVYSRMEFTLNDPTALSGLLLRLKFDNGFIAYLNGVKVAQEHAPENLSWISTATDSRRRDSEALEFVEFDLSDRLDALVSGTNVLAVHGLNHLADNSDMLLVAELTSTTSDMLAAVGTAAKVGFMPTPTPAASNVSNTGVFSGFVGETQIVGQRGFHDLPFPVEMMTSTEGARIYYTTDGSAPTYTIGTVYTGPITIDKTTTLRAAAFKDDFIPSRVDTQSFVFLDEVVRQPSDPAGFPEVWTNRLQADYEIDPSYPASDAELRAALESLPSLSIVMDLDDLFGENGFYNQGAKRQNSHLERAASIEWLSNDQRESFQINGGIQPRSHPASTALKRGFQLEFKSKYGPTKLDFPVFQDALEDNPSLPTTFDKLIVRSGFIENYTGQAYDHTGQIYVRDLLARDSEIAMTGYGTRSVWVHVYLNGLYWGMYNLTERINDEWARDVFGGDAEDWLVVKRPVSAASSGEVESGDPTRFNEMLAFFDDHDLSTAENYEIAMTYLDPLAFADYMILQNFYGIGDWPTNNVTFVMRNGDAPQPGRFVSWDAEKTFYPGSDRAAINVSGFRSKDHEANIRAWLHPHLATTDAVPGRLWRGMLKNDEFRILFADRVQKHLFNDGSLSDENLLARFDAQTARVADALIVDQARWSDDRRRNIDKGRTFTKSDWETHVAFIRDLIDGEGMTNVDVFMEAFRNAGILPSIDAPTLSQHGGAISSGFQLEVSGSNDAAIWLTTDGSDPRLADGTVNPTAIPYAGPITLGTDTIVKARAVKDAEWSALSEAEFTVGTVRQPGDANEDGRFDQVDIVLVLQAGKYLTNEIASRDEGDFNGDSRFNQLDIVLALRTGNFLGDTAGN